MTGAPGETAGRSVLPPGKLVGGRYTCERVIGEGAQGVVYLGHRRPGGEPVALKAIHRHLCGDPAIFKRFQREAAILERLDGEHVARLLDVVEEDGLVILVLEYVEGRSLEALLAARAPLPVKQAVEIGLQICAALGVAHAAGVVHRDLKPANVLLEDAGAEGSGPRVRVVDFGLAKVVAGQQPSTGLTEQDMIFGTPEYMSPEQARGEEADARSDLYAAGVILYEMVVGKVPFTGRTVIAALSAHLTEAPPAPRAARPDGSISATLEAVLLRALSKEREDRYATARALAEALVSASAGESRVIATSSTEDPEALGTGDTDLSVGAAAPAEAPERAGPRPAAGRARAGSGAPAAGAGKPGAAAASAVAPRPDAPEAPAEHAPPFRWLWAVVAIVAAAVGVAIGAVIGTR